jgi:hypothetical protein
VDVEVSDGIGYGYGLAANLVALGGGPAQAEIREVLSGGLAGGVAFNPKFTPLDLTVLPDQNGNGISELGMLAQGPTRVELRDAVTGDRLNNLWFRADFTPHQVLTLPDLNGNGSAEVGVVLTKPDEPDRVAIKDTLTKAWVQTLWAPGRYAPFDLLQVEVVSNGVGAPGVAMLLHDSTTGETAVRVADAASNDEQALVSGYEASFTPVKFVSVADFTGNGVAEYAVLGRNPDTGVVRAEIREGQSAARLSRVWFNEHCTPLDLVTVADIDANDAEELVMLGRCGEAGKLIAIVRDAQTGAFLKRLEF